jgi:hypothetical protein
MYRGELGDRTQFLGARLDYEEKRSLYMSVLGNVVTAAVLWTIWLAVKKARGTAGV